MNGQLKQLLDVTIFYPEKIPTYWEYAGGGVKTIKLHLRQLPIATDLIGDYSEDENFRLNFQAWVNQFWQEKDQRLHDYHLAAKD
jgi:hypothetical protein